MTAPTDRELAQVYEQGYRDGRRRLKAMMVDVLREIIALSETEAKDIARAALAKVAQDQQSTKGE